VNILSFSSFRLDFTNGLNVIVGPNGAGKSNVIRLVGLVRGALNLAVANPGFAIDVDRYLKIGAPGRQGSVSLGIEFTEARERALMLGFIRALVASSMQRPINDTPSVDSPIEQAVAARARSSVSEAAVESMMCGRLVLWLDGRPPVSVGFGYEFEHEGVTFHYGLSGGLGVPSGWVGRGPLVPTKRRSWGGQPLDLRQFLIADEPTEFSLASVLPKSDELIPWDLQNHPTGPHLLLSDELALALDLASDPPPALRLGLVLFRALQGSIVVTENLRRPPRTIYEMAEVGPLVDIDDAGDLPLELYRLRVAQQQEERSRFDAVQRLFDELTGLEFDVAAGFKVSPSTQSPAFTLQQSADLRGPALEFRPVSGEPHYKLQIQPVVRASGGQVPIEFAGAGVWEALIASALAVPVPGRVLLLDEPAANMHPTWQRRLLSHLSSLHQVVVVTHSPFFVPGDRVDDLSRITRLYSTPDGTNAARLGSTPEAWRHRWRQILAGSAEARGALFAQGIVLVEGDTDLGAFGRWFGSDDVVRERRRAHDALNIRLLVVGSDKSFGAYVSFLRAFEIPWAIICDGPVLSLEHEVSLVGQLTEAGVDLGSAPTREASFAEWNGFWRGHGVFTVADRFGGVKSDSDKSGEVEAFFERIDHALWHEVYERYAKSKVRAGFAFAEEVTLEEHPEQLGELRLIWDGITARLSGSSKV